MPATPSFATLLERALRTNPGAPFITWYDDTTGERVELSRTTYANWVAKTANLFVDEYDLDAGDTVRIDLPNHWLVPVFMGAAWQLGVAVTNDPATPADLVVAGPDAHAVPGVPVLACALQPFAVRFPDGPPAGTDDFGLLWPGQPDSLLAAPGSDPAVARLVEDAALVDWKGDRLLTDLHPMAEPVTTLLAALCRTGSLVLVHDASPTSWTSRSSEERATDVRRQGGSAQPSAE